MSLRRSNITLQNFQIKMRLSKKMEIMYMKMMLNLVNIMNCIKVKEKNIISFETIFKSIFSYRILTMYTLESKDDVIGFLDVVRIRIPNNNHYSDERIHHMNKHIDEIKDNINNYHDVYCFFDRMSLGQTLTVYCGLEYKEQDKIFNDCKKAEIDFGVEKPQILYQSSLL